MDAESKPGAPSPSAGPPDWVRAGHCHRVDRFLVGPELGRGGMGRVMEAWDPALGRRVALKVLHQSEPEAVIHFLQEARAQARLEHPGICRIYEVGADGTTPYIAMQLVEGRPLGELAEGLDLQAKVRLLAEVASAVHAAHQAGLIHRDLKPSNVLVERTAEGTFHPVVLDFGLAVDLALSDRTLSWGLVGTPTFMSPEQAKGEPLTPASDVYSLGATLFAVLSGRPPFEAATLAGLLTQQAVHDAPRLRRVLTGVPRDLETLVEKCLATDPRDRYASAFELEEDLRRFLAGMPLRARPVRWPERAWRTVKRHQTLSITVVVFLVALSFLVGGLIYQRRQAARQLALAQRFDWEVKDVENLLRVERLLPPHDLRPAETRVRARLDQIRQEMTRLGSIAQGPGHYALGRGYLALRDYPAALKEFTQARSLGLRMPELAYAEGLAHAGLYEDGLQRLAGIDNRAEVARRQQALFKTQGRPALACFQAGKGGMLEGAAMGEARVAYLEGKYQTCLAKCAESLQSIPSDYEARVLTSLACVKLSREAEEQGDLRTADRNVARADHELSVAETEARSDVEVLADRLDSGSRSTDPSASMLQGLNGGGHPFMDGWPFGGHSRGGKGPSGLWKVGLGG